MTLDVVILAAGKGTRMRSDLAKVLHPLAGSALIQHVVSTATKLNPRHTAIVVGHQAETVQAYLGDGPVWIQQDEQLGTGHAVQLATRALIGDGVVLVLYGDVPMASQQTLQRCVEAANLGHVGLVTAYFEEPAELGRIVRDASGAIQAIVEFKDADTQQREINEINSGIMAVPAHRLIEWLSEVKPNNAQGEYYLTDVIALAVRDGVVIDGIVAETPEEVTGVNDRVQLAQLERFYQTQQAERLMRAGATIADPSRLDIRGAVSVGQDCFIDINVVLEGEVTLGRGVHLGPGVVIKDSVVADNVEVQAHTVIEGAVIARNCILGPFARIRPDTILEDGVKIGNFVETKKVQIGKGSKANHLTYLGDATLGASCNIGAGTVTCNYDGINKHPTSIGDNVFVGTNSTLVAPIVIDSGAYVAAGSTLTLEVGGGDLAVGRAKQRNIKGWVRPDQREGKK